ncbi:hypothetical protein [Streptomyces albidochromogenes]|uniref:Uncharacterized protein n=1 Tax=Streptomyces albidochromogenes TaxID=329524 RepID=A0ABW6FTG1_9ACTN
MGLVLFPGDDDTGDGDTDSPDVSWSYTGFDMFRRWLAQAEGLVLDDMRGFGGERPWSGVSTTLAPLLDHPDDHGELTPAECAAILPRLEEIADQREAGTADALDQRRVDDTRQLIVVLRLCVEKDVGLIFG